jgi:hypothetical protein
MNWPLYWEDIQDRYYQSFPEAVVPVRRSREWLPMWSEEKQVRVSLTTAEVRARFMARSYERIRNRKMLRQRRQARPSFYLQRLEAQREAQRTEQLQRYARLTRQKRK